jgi:phosphoglycerate dehydrogenase-like enzyme
MTDGASGMKVAFWPSLAGREIEASLRKISGADLTVVDDIDKLAAAAPETEVLVIGGHFFDGRVAELLRARAPRLRFIQSFTAGYEGLQAHGVPPGVVVANAGDSWSPAVAEHGMALLLALVKRLPHAIINQSRGIWDRSHSARMGTLEGQTLAIVGFGSIGREFARRARPFGMRIVGLSRRAIPDPLADEVQPVSALRTVLARADVVLIAVPYSKDTHHLIGADELAACKPGTILINIARGGLVDPVALAAALASGRLGAAGTDVTEPEPLPAGDPLWGAPNLIITPHVAGASGPVGRDRLAGFVAANVARFVAGEPVSSVVTL